MAPSIASYREARTNFIAYLLVGVGGAAIVYCLPESIRRPDGSAGLHRYPLRRIDRRALGLYRPAWRVSEAEGRSRLAGCRRRDCSLQLALATRIERFAERLAWILGRCHGTVSLCARELGLRQGTSRRSAGRLLALDLLDRSGHRSCRAVLINPSDLWKSPRSSGR